eukprot:13494159-Ditylum_brightwellii.AAC.1
MYTVDQICALAAVKRPLEVAVDDSSSASSGYESTSEEESDDKDVANVTIDEVGMSTADKAPDATSSGKYMSKLLAMPLEELKARPLARDAYAAAIKTQIDLIANRFRQLYINGSKIDVTKYPVDDKVIILKDALLLFDPEYNDTYRSKGQLAKMPLINKFFYSNEHVRVGPYSLEICLCGKESCDLCDLMGRR